MLLSIDDIRVRHVRVRNTPSDLFVQLKKVNCEGVLVYTASQTVTYHVDTNVSYQEDVEYGSSCLSPTTFTPKKTGWTFVGWREDTSAISSVLSSKVMGENPIALYAVFKQTVTCTFKSYNSTQTASGVKYYNNSDVLGADVKVPNGATYSGWSWRGWGLSDTDGDSDVVYSNGATIRGLVSGQTYYGLYNRTLTLSYNGNGASSGSVASQNGTQYWNACGSYTNPTFVLAGNGYSKAYWSFTKWAMGSTSGTQYAAGSSVTLSANTTFYAVWTQTSCTSAVVMNSIDCYETTWERLTVKSLTNNPSNNAFFTRASDGSYITVNKACRVNIYLEAKVGGGFGVVSFKDQYGNGYGSPIDLNDEQDVCSGSTSHSFSAGSRIYTEVYNYTASGDGEITFTVDWMNITLTASV